MQIKRGAAVSEEDHIREEGGDQKDQPQQLSKTDAPQNRLRTEKKCYSYNTYFPIKTFKADTFALSLYSYHMLLFNETAHITIHVMHFCLNCEYAVFLDCNYVLLSTERPTASERSKHVLNIRYKIIVSSTRQ